MSDPVEIGPVAGCALFETAIGRCGIAWNPSGISAVAFPGASDAATRAALARRCTIGDAAASGEIQHAIASITALLDGEPRELAALRVDDSGGDEFERSVWDAARTINFGETLTYGEIAAMVGAPGDAREVGQALGRNPTPIVVPCHRVVAAGGRLGGFSAPGGTNTKLRLLEIERESAGARLTLFDAA